MTDRKPDFYVVKRARNVDGASEWLNVSSDWRHEWTTFANTRGRYFYNEAAIKDAALHGGEVVPVYCTSKRAEPKMRERSSAWVLKRLAEGKVVVHHRSGIELMYRFCDGQIQYYDDSLKRWKASAGIGDDNGCTARIARPSEVPQ